jgi:hypothetical protein
VRAYTYWVADFGFTSEIEAIQYGNPSMTHCPVNEYGAERFMCRAIWKTQGEERVAFHYERTYTVASLYDRKRSVLVRFGPKEADEALERGIAIPFHEAGYRQFTEVIHTHGSQSQSMYLWVRRVGDCIEVE